MRTPRTCLPLVLAGLAAASPSLPAQCLDWGREHPPIGVLGPGATLSMAAFDTGSGPALALGGNFSIAGTAVVANVVAFDGTAWHSLDAGLNGIVRALIPFDDGTGPALFAGGQFTASGGTPLSRIARWNGSAWAALGNGPGGDVHALATFDDGAGNALHASGPFGFARWDGVAWTSLPGLSGTIQALAAFDDGSGPALFAGGYDLDTGTGPLNTVARWNGSQWQGVGAFDWSVQDLEPFDDGSGLALYACGGFSQSGGAPIHRVARWNGTSWANAGLLDMSLAYDLQTFDDGSGERLYAATTGRGILAYDGATWAQLGGGMSAAVYAIAPFDDGSGARLFASATTTPHPTEPRGLVAWNGTAWATAAPGDGFAGRVTVTASHAGAGGGPPELHIASDWTFAAGNPLTATSIARLGSTGWEPLGDVTMGEFHALQSFGGLLFAGIGDLRVSDVLVARHTAVWNGTSWMQAGAVNGKVYALTTFDSGGGPELYAGGAFTVGGSTGNVGPMGRVARWNGTGWQAVGTGIVAPPVFSVYVRALAGYAGELYAGGTFGLDSGFARIARWNGTSWSSVGTGMDGTVNALAVFGGELYAGGSFTSAGGSGAPYLARWNGTAWSDVGGAVDGPVSALAVHDDGAGLALFVGGDFTQAGGVAARSLARWDGANWSSAGAGLGSPGLGPVPQAYALGTHGGALYVGGSFDTAGRVGSPNLARWSGCATPIDAFCAGDGSLATACPCGNSGAAGRGCAWHNGPSGALLVASGAPGADSVVLSASGMPLVAQSIFLKGDAAVQGGTPFGDGVLCLGSAIVRLGSKTSAGGAAQYPGPGDLSVGVRGGTPPGSGIVAYYQTYYRNAASFCTSATFNATNGARIAW